MESVVHTNSVKTLYDAFTGELGQENSVIMGSNVHTHDGDSVFSSTYAYRWLYGDVFKKEGLDLIAEFGDIARELLGAKINYYKGYRTKCTERFLLSERLSDAGIVISIIDSISKEQISLPVGISLEFLDLRVHLYANAKQIIGADVINHQMVVGNSVFTEFVDNGKPNVTVIIQGAEHTLYGMTLNKLKLNAIQTLPMEQQSIVLFCDLTLVEEPITQSRNLARQLFFAKQVCESVSNSKTIDVFGTLITERKKINSIELLIKFPESNYLLHLPPGITLYELAKKSFELLTAKEKVLSIFGDIDGMKAFDVNRILGQMLVIYDAYLESIQHFPDPRDSAARSIRCADYLENNPAYITTLRHFFDEQRCGIDYFEACQTASYGGRNTNHPYQDIFYPTLQPIPSTLKTALSIIASRERARADAKKLLSSIGLVDDDLAVLYGIFVDFTVWLGGDHEYPKNKHARFGEYVAFYPGKLDAIKKLGKNIELVGNAIQLRLNNDHGNEFVEVIGAAINPSKK